MLRSSPLSARSGWRALVLAAGCLAVVFCTPAVDAASYSTPDAPLLGSAWYPEQWPASRWEADLALMQAAHFDVVRIGEFAWSSMEPSEGHYDFGWLDRAIALAGRHGIRVVLGTPTDAPPAWLTTKYPDTLGVNADGHRREHGGRRQFNYASPRYRQFCASIVREMGRRYGHNPNVIGWQIGNEYTDESFDPETRLQFQQFLRSKYRTLANLNAHWTTAYWSQTYTDWSQIPLEATHGNPGLLLEHKHFVTATWRSFQRNQIDALRPLIAPTQFITTNIGGLAWSDNWDHYEISADLDLASWDDYVGEGHLDAAKNAMLNDFVRGWKRENFWVMETQPGSVNWAPINNALDPGETRALAWQTVGHGADAVLYWQWRSALNGQEQYHGAIVGADGRPLPLYPELQELGADFAAVHEALQGTLPHAEIGLLHTYDSRWAIDFQPHTALYDQQAVLLRFYAPLQQLAESRGEAIDIMDPTRGSLGAYKFLVAPSLNVISEALAEKLRAWVENGGHLLLGPRSGMKDEFDALNPQRQPGPLAAALGAKVEQYYALDDSPQSAVEVPASPRLATPSGKASIWAEALTPLPSHGSDSAASSPRTDLIYKQPRGWLDGQPAMMTRTLGRGTISYLGTLPDEPLLRDILLHLAADAGVPSGPNELPRSVELCVRSDPAHPAHSVWILINHGATTASVTLKAALRSLLPNPPGAFRSNRAETTFTLAPQAVAVLTPESRE